MGLRTNNPLSNTHLVNLVPYKVEITEKRLNSVLIKNGRTYRKIYYPSIREYVDLNTGEIFCASIVHRQFGAPLDYSLRILQRQAVLDSLRSEVREFAIYVLQFRNKRRGLTPDINTLCTWYGEHKGIRSDNVKRYLKKMNEILVDDSLLTPLFEMTDGQMSARDFIGESTKARVIRMLLLLSLIHI